MQRFAAGADDEKAATPNPTQSGMASGCKKFHKGMYSLLVYWAKARLLTWFRPDSCQGRRVWENGDHVRDFVGRLLQVESRRRVELRILVAGYLLLRWPLKLLGIMSRVLACDVFLGECTGI